MQIPSLLYGQAGEVRKRCRRAFRHHARNQQRFWEAFAADDMIDTADHQGLISVEGTYSSGKNETLYCCSMPLYLFVIDRQIERTPAMEEEIFSTGLEAPWRLLCMFSRQTMYSWFRTHDPARFRPDRFARYVMAILRYWDVLDAEGARYAGGLAKPEAHLWDVADALKFVLANLGVPHNLLREPLPQVGGLYALLSQADPAKAGALVEFGKANASSWRNPVKSGEADLDEEATVGNIPTGTFVSDEMSGALRADDPKTVRRLIEAGEAVDAIDYDSLRSPLLWASEHGYTDLVGFLLDHGANIEDWADEGESPLMLAAYEGYRDTVQLLLDRGADPCHRTKNGWSVLDFAELKNHDDLAELLRDVQSRQCGDTAQDDEQGLAESTE